MVGMAVVVAMGALPGGAMEIDMEGEDIVVMTDTVTDMGEGIEVSLPRFFSNSLPLQFVIIRRLLS